MPYWFDYDSDHRLLRCRVEGVTGDEELRRCYHAVHVLFDKLQPRAGILDLTAVTSFEVSTETIRAIAASPPAIAAPEVPRVIIAPKPNIYGFARMYQQLGAETRPSLMIVHRAEEAYAALGVAPQRFERVEEPAA